jgi:hypothetical protein
MGTGMRTPVHTATAVPMKTRLNNRERGILITGTINTPASEI